MVTRIISSWYKLGQDQDFPLFDSNRNVLSPKRNELIRELAAKSIVLLKNENKALPLSPGGFISVFGQAASMSLLALVATIKETDIQRSNSTASLPRVDSVSLHPPTQAPLQAVSVLLTPISPISSPLTRQCKPKLDKEVRR